MLNPRALRIRVPAWFSQGFSGWCGGCIWIKLILLSVISLNAQGVFNDFSPTVKGVTVGQEHCYFWANYPINLAVTSACYKNNRLVWISVQNFGPLDINDSISGQYDATPDSTAPAMKVNIQWTFLYNSSIDKVQWFITTVEPDLIPNIVQQGIF